VCSGKTVLQHIKFLILGGELAVYNVPRKLCVPLTRKIKVPTLESIYEMLCQSESRDLGGE